MDHLTKIFTYSERLEQAVICFNNLKDEHLDPNDTSMSFLNLIAREWVIESDDLVVAIWNSNNQPPTKDAHQ
jgi:hypothetical protein